MCPGDRCSSEGIRAHEPDALISVVHAVDGEPGQRIFYELYADQDAFAAHAAQPHIRSFMAARDQYVASFTVDRVHPLTGKGIDTLAGPAR